MTTVFKRLLLISITVLLGVMSAGVRAQIDYFTFSTAPNSAIGTSSTLSGNFQGSGGNLTSFTGSFNGGAVSLSGDLGGYSVVSHKMTGLDLIYADGVANGPYETLYFRYVGAQLNVNSYNSLSQGGSSTATFTYTGSGGAPEIDGSLAPKVGLLLGCSFLMFRRRTKAPV